MSYKKDARLIRVKITIRLSNNLDPDQARQFVGPDLGPNCLQMAQAGKLKGLSLRHLIWVYTVCA